MGKDFWPRRDFRNSVSKEIFNPGTLFSIKDYQLKPEPEPESKLIKGVLKLGMPDVNEIRKISLGLQVSTLLTYVTGIAALKKSHLKKDGILKHGKINTAGYLMGSLSLLYMMYSATRLIITRKAPAAVFIHGPFGLVTLALSSLFVANRWSWKTVKNMRSLVVLFLSTFSGGIYLFSVLNKREKSLKRVHRKRIFTRKEPL